MHPDCVSIGSRALFLQSTVLLSLSLSGCWFFILNISRSFTKPPFNSCFSSAGEKDIVKLSEKTRESQSKQVLSQDQSGSSVMELFFHGSSCPAVWRELSYEYQHFMYCVSLRMVVPLRATEEMGKVLYMTDSFEPEVLRNVTLEGPGVI